MQTLRRRRPGLQLVKKIALLGIAVSAAWLIRETKGAPLFEIYNMVTRPFHNQVTPDPQARLINPKIEELTARVTELEKQNEQLQKLLGYVSAKKIPGTVAPIIGRSADHWWKQVTLGRGAKAGIKQGFIAMGPGGLVGQIVSVTPHTSQVLLVSDPSSKVGVTISRSRQMGFMRGLKENRAVMEFFDNVPNVKPGDVVTTSAFSQLFPAGLPVGKIVSIDMNKNPAPEATIEFLVPINSLEWVVVYPNEKSLAEKPINEKTPNEKPMKDQGTNESDSNPPTPEPKPE